MIGAEERLRLARDEVVRNRPRKERAAKVGFIMPQEDRDHLVAEAAKAGISMGSYLRECLIIADLVRMQQLDYDDDDAWSGHNDQMWSIANALWPLKEKRK